MKIRYSKAAEFDIISIYSLTVAEFGVDARERYELLLTSAALELADNPKRIGSRAWDDFADGIRSWHSKLSRNTAPPRYRVKNPRHIIVYRIDGDTLVIGRVLHESMDIAQHLDDNTWD